MNVYLCRMLAAHWDGNPNVVYCKAKGSGGANEMTGVLQDGEVMYGLGKLCVRDIYLMSFLPDQIHLYSL